MRIIVILLFSIFLSKGYAQPRFSNKHDSILFSQADTVFALSSRNSDSALSLAKDLLLRSAQSAGKRSLANIHNAMGWAYMHNGHLDSSVTSLRTAWSLFSKANDTSGIIRTCINIAEVYTRQNKIANAIQFLTQADSLCVLTGNKIFHTNVQRQLGIVYREAKDYRRAAFYLSRALSEFMILKDSLRFVSTGISLSILYRNLNLPDSSLFILNQCYDIVNLNPALRYEFAMVQEHLAETYFQTFKFKKALEHYTDAYLIFKKINNKADIAYEGMNIGKVLWKLKRMPEAEKYLLEAYHLSDTLKMLNYQYDAAQSLADMYSQNGNWEKAYQFRTSATVLRDSIDLGDQVKLANELKEKFETEKKENEITLLKTKVQLTEADNKKNRLWQYLFGVLFIASVIIGWLLLNRVRIRRKLNEQLLRNQIAGDLHDDIGSALSVIDISSRIALDKREDPAIVSEQLKKIKQFTTSTMESMSDIVWSVNPKNDNLESIMIRVHEFATEVCEPMHINLEIDMAKGLDRISVDTHNRKHILLLCKEAINNAVKYSRCTMMKIKSEIDGNETGSITITDNGTGFDQDVVKKGNGLANMNTRANALGGRLQIHSVKGNGTTVELIFPVG